MGVRHKPGKLHWVFTIFGVLVLLSFASSLAAQQATTPRLDVSAVARTFEMDQQHLVLMSAISSNRQAFVQQTADLWVETAAERGFSASWREELELALNSLCDEKLAATRLARSYDDLVATISGTAARSTSPPRGPSTLAVKLLGDDATDLVYFPVTPCRLVDTRSGGGPIAANTSRNFFMNGSLTAQGGNGAGCGIPTDPAAIAVTVTSTQQAGTGDLRAYPYLGALPLASVLNYRAGVDIASNPIIPTCQICGLDFTIRADAAATDVLVDVVGYFWSPNATAVNCTYLSNSVSMPQGFNSYLSTAACPAGFSLTGGGAEFTGTIVNQWTYKNGPTGSTTWTAGFYNNSGATNTGFVYSICCRVPGR